VPGGPRGLQNRCRPVLRVRGKFDSYPLRHFFSLSVKRRQGFGEIKTHRKGGVINVARANSQTDLALVLRWLSVQTQPKGSDAGLTSATTDA